MTLPLPEPVPADHRVSTGDLPTPDVVVQAMQDAYDRYLDMADGQVATYIPALANAPADWFGVSLAGVHGAVFSLGDAQRPFSIQSLSKPFVFALVCEAIGHHGARQRLGVNNAGLPFDSVMAIELNEERTANPMVNAGAIATTSLIPGDTAEEQWAVLLDGLSRFAGRALTIDDEVYESERASNMRNHGIAHLLAGYERMYCDPDQAVEVYTRQCSVGVTCEDIAVMAATLADGGVNPLTRERVVDAELCKRVLAVLATAGLYDRSGDWLYEIGLPGKSGVSGGMITVAPGKGGLGVFSPPLDEAGNSVRGQLVTAYLSESLGLNLFASKPAPD